MKVPLRGGGASSAPSRMSYAARVRGCARARAIGGRRHGHAGRRQDDHRRALSRDLGLPLVSRDKIKERLYDTLGVGDLEWSGRLGGAAFALLFDSARLMTESGHSVMLEATSSRDRAGVLRASVAPRDSDSLRRASRRSHGAICGPNTTSGAPRCGETEGTARTLSERRSRTAGPPRRSDRRRYVTSR